MKKKIISIIGLLWGTIHGGHLALNTPQKIDFTNKRISLIEKSLGQKLNEKTLLEKKLKDIEKTSNEATSIALLQANILALNTDITDLQSSIAVAKNSVKSLLPQQ